MGAAVDNMSLQFNSDHSVLPCKHLLDIDAFIVPLGKSIVIRQAMIFCSTKEDCRMAVLHNF